MLRLRGDRASLLAALLSHWCEQQLALPIDGARPGGAAPTQQEQARQRNATNRCVIMRQSP